MKAYLRCLVVLRIFSFCSAGDGSPGIRRSRGGKRKTTMKYATTTARASKGRPAPQAIATAVSSHAVAAVVSPVTLSPLTKMSPAPMKPIPVTIWAATREGSKTIRSLERTSINRISTREGTGRPSYRPTCMSGCQHSSDGLSAQAQSRQRAEKPFQVRRSV